MNSKFENYTKNKSSNLYSIWIAKKAEVVFTDGELMVVNVIDWDEDFY
ncbi:hypothetical protein [Caloranaerobacter azorensis]|nr:hypothetical protein [Caloranaerobacter azorensis]